MRTQGKKSVDWYILLSTLALLAGVAAYFYWAAVRIGGGSDFGANAGQDYVIATPGQRVIDGSGGNYPGVDEYSLATPTPFFTATATPLPPTATSPADALATMPVSLLTTYYRSPSEFCYGCEVYKMNVKFTHYEPWLGDINCWDYHDDYCWSNMAADVAWEPFIGLAAACPPSWPFGTWVELPGYGAYVCMDRGNEVICNLDENYCQVDVLGDVLGEHDGSVIQAIVYIHWGNGK